MVEPDIFGPPTLPAPGAPLASPAPAGDAPQGAEGALSIRPYNGLRQRIVVMDPTTGLPVVDTRGPIIERKDIPDLMLRAAAQPYDGPDPRYRGMTLMEVMVYRQAELAAETGDPEKIFDRLLGKPTAKSETATTVHITYEAKVKQLAEKLKDAPPPTEDVIIEAEVVPAAEDPLGGL